MKKTTLLILLLAVLIGILIFAIFNQQDPELVPAEQAVEKPKVIEESRQPIVHYPVPESEPEPAQAEEAADETTPLLSLPEKLPPLHQSDTTMQEVFGELFGEKSGYKLLKFNNFIPKAVVSIDNLAEKQLAKDHLPISRPAGRFIVSGAGDVPQTSSRNHKRYIRYVELFEAIDPELAIKIYVHFYPLFQAAYKQLGYPNAYFNDRLVFAIDHLLKTPEQPEPILLMQPLINYTYADPALEKLSAGQKILLRIGPDNRRRVKQQLKKYRQLLVNSEP